MTAKPPDRAPTVEKVSTTPTPEPKDRLAQADEPGLSAEDLIKLSKDPWTAVRAAVARHPNTPKETLLILGNDYSKDVRYWVAANPNTSADVLESISKTTKAMRTTREIRAAAARNPSISEATQERLAKSGDRRIISGLVENPKLTTKVLAYLVVYHGGPYWPRAVRHPAMAGEILASMAKAGKWDSGLLTLVLSQPEFPEEEFVNYATDNRMEVREAVQRNPRAPLDAAVAATYTKYGLEKFLTDKGVIRGTKETTLVVHGVWQAREAGEDPLNLAALAGQIVKTWRSMSADARKTAWVTFEQSPRVPVMTILQACMESLHTEKRTVKTRTRGRAPAGPAEGRA